MVVPWWVCWIFLDLGFVVEVVVVVGWGGGWRWLAAAAAAFFCTTFFLLASNCEKKNGLGTWESVDSKKQYKHFLTARLTRLLCLPLQTKKKNKKSSTNNKVKFISHSHVHTQNITIAYLLLCIDLLGICLRVNKSFCNFFFFLNSKFHLRVT